MAKSAWQSKCSRATFYDRDSRSIQICIFLNLMPRQKKNSLGRPGVDAHVKHEECAAVLRLQFLINEGALVSATEDDTLHLWNFRQKIPQVVHSLKFQRDRSVISTPQA